MTWAYFDCFSGAAGDMILGALVDAGADLSVVQQVLGRLNVPGCTVRAEKVTKQGLAATQITVPGEGEGQAPHRSLGTIRSIIEKADLPRRVTERSVAVFTRLAEAEAAVHNCGVQEVHFHEVGAVDAIADIVGSMTALENLGVDRVLCSPIAVGSGTVTCAHGVLPVPAPATARLLREVPLADCDEAGELATPTGAAVLTALATSFGPLPAMTIRRIGYGAGRREGRRRPNVLRVLLGQGATDGQADQVAVLEANLDDTSPETIAYCCERLLEVGALDVYTVPIYMKKSRPGVLLTALCRPADVADLEGVLFAETPTLGIRRHLAERSKLDRELVPVETPFGTISVKVGRRQGRTITAAPEYEDCRSAAQQHAVPLRVVMDAATQAWRQRVAQADAGGN